MAAETVIRRGRGRRPLKDLSANDINISAGKTAASPLPAYAVAARENLSGLPVVLSPIKNKKILLKKPGIAASPSERLFADELQEMQKRLEQLRLERDKTEEILRQRDEILKQKEEELENRGKEQERLQKELKKLQTLKEFKPTMSFPLVKSLREKEQEKIKKKKKKRKKNRDCGEKKKPCPPYILWCKDQWNEVKKENPDANFKEISTILGARWKNVSAEEKKPYEEKYQQDKEAFLVVVGQEKRENEAMKLLEEEQMQKSAMELLEQYLQFKQEADKESKKKRREKKDPLKPKKPMSAFFLYSKERRAALKENKNVLEIAKIAGEEWKNMTEEKRAPYKEVARKQKDEYDREMELYKQKQLVEAANLEKEEEEQKKVFKQEALQMLKKKEKTENIIKKTKETRLKQKKQREGHNSDMNKPKKPASSFLLFSKEARKQLLQERQGINNSTLSALVAVKWKELSQADKQIWGERAAEGMAKYKREMEDYNKAIAEGSNMNHESSVL